MDKHLVAAARKWGLLPTTPVSEKRKLLVLSPEEHADNQEMWFKAMNVWECEKKHCRNCSVKQQNSCLEAYNETDTREDHIGVYVVNTKDNNNYSTATATLQEHAHALACVRREAEVKGMTPEPVRLDPLEHPLADGSGESYIYFGVAVHFGPRRGPGRPKAGGTPEERKAERAERLRKLGMGGWTPSKLAALKRSDLLYVASSVGIHDPARKGGNDDLRKAILETARKPKALVKLRKSV